MGFFSPVNPFEFYTKLRLAKEIAGAYRELAEIARTIEPDHSRICFSALNKNVVPSLKENARYHEGLRFRLSLPVIDKEDLKDQLHEVRESKGDRYAPLHPFYRLSREERDEWGIVGGEHSHGYGGYTHEPSPRALRVKKIN